MLDCIDADFYNQIRIFQHFARSARFEHLCTAPNLNVASYWRSFFNLFWQMLINWLFSSKECWIFSGNKSTFHSCRSYFLIWFSPSHHIRRNQAQSRLHTARRSPPPRRPERTPGASRDRLLTLKDWTELCIRKMNNFTDSGNFSNFLMNLLHFYQNLDTSSFCYFLNIVAKSRHNSI